MADGIIAALDWLGMAPDEGPYLQSAARTTHQAPSSPLGQPAPLYACDCTREEIDERTKAGGGG